MTEGYVGMLEPFIDTVVICTLTALVILTTVYEPGLEGSGIHGIALTSKAFGSTIGWSILPLSFIAILFAFRLCYLGHIWSQGMDLFAGESMGVEIIFKVFFCIFVAFGSMIS